MSFTPFRKQQLSTRAHLAAMAAGAAAATGVAPPMPEEGSAAAEYQTLLIQLHEDLRRLHEIQSRDAKIELKRAAIEAYRPWVDGVLAAAADGQASPQDEIVVTVFIWSLDIADWPRAIVLARHVIDNGLQLPERFHRTPGGLLVSEIGDAALNVPGSVPHDLLVAALPSAPETALPAWDMKNETLARLHRAIGESWARQAEDFDPNADSAPAGGKAMLVDAALTSLREAMRLHPAVGVKKLVEQLEREAKKLAEAAGATGEQ